MAKKAEEDLTKHTLNLFPGDYSRLQELYPDIGAGPVIRRLVRDFLDKIEAAKSSTSLTERINL